jgi:hypothetical protein
MQFRVIPNFVAARYGFPHQIRALTHVSPNHKKSRFRIVSIQKIKQFRSEGRIRPIVKGDGQLTRRVGPANGSSKKLRAWIRRPVSGSR